MKVEIEIPDETIASVARQHGTNLFTLDRYGDKPMGLKAIHRQVEEAVGTIDFGPLIRAAIEPLLGPTIDEVLREVIKKRARKVAKEMEDNGTLLNTKGNTEEPHE